MTWSHVIHFFSSSLSLNMTSSPSVTHAISSTPNSRHTFSRSPSHHRSSSNPPLFPFPFPFPWESHDNRGIPCSRSHSHAHLYGQTELYGTARHYPPASPRRGITIYVVVLSRSSAQHVSPPLPFHVNVYHTYITVRRCEINRPYTDVASHQEVFLECAYDVAAIRMAFENNRWAPW